MADFVTIRVYPTSKKTREEIQLDTLPEAVLHFGSDKITLVSFSQESARLDANPDETFYTAIYRRNEETGKQ